MGEGRGRGEGGSTDKDNDFERYCDVIQNGIVQCYFVIYFSRQ